MLLWLTVNDTLGVRPLAPAAADRHAHHRVALKQQKNDHHGNATDGRWWVGWVLISCLPYAVI